MRRLTCTESELWDLHREFFALPDTSHFFYDRWLVRRGHQRFGQMLCNRYLDHSQGQSWTELFYTEDTNKAITLALNDILDK